MGNQHNVLGSYKAPASAPTLSSVDIIDLRYSSVNSSFAGSTVSWSANSSAAALSVVSEEQSGSEALSFSSVEYAHTLSSMLKLEFTNAIEALCSLRRRPIRLCCVVNRRSRRK